MVDVDVYNKGHPMTITPYCPIGLAWCKVSEINIVISSSFLYRNNRGGGTVLSSVVDHFTPVSGCIYHRSLSGLTHLLQFLVEDVAP